MAFTPTTVTLNSWASPIAITSTDAISNLDEAVNAIITTDAASLTTHLNTEMAKIPSYLTSNLSTMYTEAVAAITVPIAADKNAAAASAAAALVSETNANASAISAAASAALLTTQISNLVEDTTPQLGGNLDTNGFTISGYAPLVSPTFTGIVTIPTGASIAGYAPIESPNLTGTATVDKLKATGLVSYDDTAFDTNIDCSLGNSFSKTVTANFTLTFSNVPPAGEACIIVLRLTNAGAYVITWATSIKWGGTPPLFTAAGRDNVTLYTIDGGTSWDAYPKIGIE